MEDVTHACLAGNPLVEWKKIEVILIGTVTVGRPHGGHSIIPPDTAPLSIVPLETPIFAACTQSCSRCMSGGEGYSVSISVFSLRSRCVRGWPAFCKRGHDLIQQTLDVCVREVDVPCFDSFSRTLLRGNSKLGACPPWCWCCRCRRCGSSSWCHRGRESATMPPLSLSPYRCCLFARRDLSAQRQRGGDSAGGGEGRDILFSSFSKFRAFVH